jgi:hypothetical protein
MKEGLEEFLKRIEVKPTNETLIDRFVTLVLEEEVLERILYLKKLVGLLLTPNPYAALKAAALELQEARKEKLTKEYEVGALKDVESCFLKLEKMDNAALVRDEINKLQSEMARENTVTRGRTPPPTIPQAEADEAEADELPLPVRQARVHFRLPSPDAEDEEQDDERTAQHIPSEADSMPPSPPRAAQRSVPPVKPDAAQNPMDAQYAADIFGYTPKHKSSAQDVASSLTGPKEFYDRNLEDADDQSDESARRSSLSKVSGLKVGPNLLETPEDREPPRPRNIQSVFETTDVFPSNDEAVPDQEAPFTVDKPSRSSRSAGKGRSRAAYDGSEEVPDSNAMFQESQQVHFPEASSQRSMTRKEGQKLFSYDMNAPAMSGSPLENTEILPESNLMNAPIPFDNEATTQLDPEELMRSHMPPAEPAFPPREFDLPPFDFPPQEKAKAPTPAKNKAKDPFAGVRDAKPMEREAFAPTREPDPVADVFAPARASNPSPARDPFAKAREPVDPFAGIKDAAPPPQSRDPFAGLRESPAPAPVRDPMPFPKDLVEPKAAPVMPAIPTPMPAPGSSPPPASSSPTSASAAAATKGSPLQTEPRWNLLRDRLRLLSGIQISRSHANDFVLRLLGENSSREEQQEVLSVLMRVLEGSRQAAAEQRFLAFLFEELQPKALHQLLGALKIGDQTVVFFADYLQSLLKERQLRRMLNVIHAVIVPGLDLSWYQESYRFLMMIWPELGLKGWHWLEEEGPMAFCERLAVREDLLPATLLA